LTRSCGVTKNESGVKFLAVALSLAIEAAAVTAPLRHAHTDAHPTDHHPGRTVHMHWAGHGQDHHGSGSPAIAETDHDRPVFLRVLVAVARTGLPAAGLTLDVFALPIPVEQRTYRAVEVVHSHGPPLCRTRSPRAPPAFLS
jgi:hypothetical protein